MTEPSPDNTTISIIIPTRNAGRHFAELLDGLQKQSLKPDQIIVVDSESTDATPELARSRNCEVIKVDRANFDHGTTRKLAVSKVSGKFAVFLTQDAVPTNKHMIAELIKPMQADANIAICYGRQLPGPNATPLERLAREFNYPEKSRLKTKNDIKTLGLKTFFCSNSCSAIRCSTFNKLGGFKDNVIVNEDMHFAAKAIHQGYSVFYTASAKVYHSHLYTLPQTFRRYFKIGRFFADNKWLLKQASIKGYGGGMMKTGIKTFWKNRMPYCIIVLLIEFAIKALAYKFGWYYQLLSQKHQIPSD